MKRGPAPFLAMTELNNHQGPPCYHFSGREKDTTISTKHWCPDNLLQKLLGIGGVSLPGLSDDEQCISKAVCSCLSANTLSGTGTFWQGESSGVDNVFWISG